MSKTMLKIEVKEGFHLPESRTFNETVRWSQKMYVHAGGAYPFEAKLPLDGPQDALEVGIYTLQPSAFQAGKYGDLELNRFDMAKHMVKLPPQSVQPAKSA